MVILGAVGALTFLVTRQAVTPIQRAAATASRLAQGNLEERMPVRGQDEMTVLARSFNDMAASLETQIEQLEKLSVAQRRFVSDVSHELRTPLTTISMASELIYDSRAQLDAGSARSAELLQSQIDRFEVLLADLLEISRFDAGAASLETEEVDVVALVHKVVQDAEPLAHKKAVNVNIIPLSGPCTARVDNRRIERILRNLVSNAIDHAEGKPVHVVISGDSAALAVVVRDHGVGLSKEQATHVFDRFWRADPSRARTTGGTGLGLSISQEDARLHAGNLDVWGVLGMGTSFRLVLPRTAANQITQPPLPVNGFEIDEILAKTSVNSVNSVNSGMTRKARRELILAGANNGY
ncbi:MAG: HAMP domain-containing histidine kinase, partial [Cellulomonadaceae bacterium]|jgi:two-component system sensor histidine kinase MtrB|nr:HAMP domain-containing histidine kinase [Cellulomonadaceae bacterium]